MGSFFRRWWRLLAAAVLVFAAIQVFVHPFPPLDRAAPARAAGSSLFRPFYLAVDFLRKGVSGVWSHYVALVGVSRENDRLRREVASLQEKLHASRDAQLENRRLKELLRYSETLERRTIGARVVGPDITPGFQAVFIGAGSEAGVEEGMSVVTPQGAVGRVHKAMAGLSEVLLVTDG
ncbi:MAG TPA: rod shape-determining protein MreC, partial [Candidatus Deferrimicrobiaceae bacterium]